MADEKGENRIDRWKTAAPSLEEARAARLLPDYGACLSVAAGLRRRPLALTE